MKTKEEVLNELRTLSFIIEEKEFEFDVFQSIFNGFFLTARIIIQKNKKCYLYAMEFMNVQAIKLLCEFMEVIENELSTN